MWRRLITELYGTTIFVFFIVASGGTPVTILFGLWSCIVGTGMISGAHFNPTVTLGVMIRKMYLKKLSKEDLIQLATYIGVQLVGAVCGTLLGWTVVGKTFPIKVGEDSGILQAYIAEIVFSFTLVIAAILIGEINDSLMLGALAVASVVFVGIATVGEISGGCFNPAFCLGNNLVHTYIEWDLWYLKESHLYIIAPLVGGVVGSLCASMLLEKPLAEFESACHEEQMKVKTARE